MTAMKSRDLITRDLTTQHHIAGVDSARLENAGTSKAHNGNFDQMAADQCKVSYLNLYPFIFHSQLIHHDHLNDVAGRRNCLNSGRLTNKSSMLIDN